MCERVCVCVGPTATGLDFISFIVVNVKVLYFLVMMMCFHWSTQSVMCHDALLPAVSSDEGPYSKGPKESGAAESRKSSLPGTMRLVPR